MIDNFRRWYSENHLEITWFLIGVLTFSGIMALAVGNYLNALINFGFAYLNFVFRK